MLNVRCQMISMTRRAETEAEDSIASTLQKRLPAESLDNPGLVDGPRVRSKVGRALGLFHVNPYILTT